MPGPVLPLLLVVVFAGVSAGAVEHGSGWALRVCKDVVVRARFQQGSVAMLSLSQASLHDSPTGR